MEKTITTMAEDEDSTSVDFNLTSCFFAADKKGKKKKT